MSETPLVELKDLSHTFGNGHKALCGVNLVIERRSFTVIGGENGSGKTVLMKHLNGILRPGSGSVNVDGIPVEDDSYNARRKVGLIFQNSDTQFIAQSVREDIAFGPENLGIRGSELERRVTEAAGALDVESILEESPHRLSGGEKKKAAIAGVIAMEPELIVFDEPFAALDFKGVKMLLRKMLSLHKNGRTIIVITHDLEKVLAHADRLIIMSEGMIASSGPPSAVLADAARYGLRVPSHGNPKKMTWLESPE